MQQQALFISLDEKERRATGISDNLVRYALGIEDADDIIADLAQALDYHLVRVMDKITIVHKFGGTSVGSRRTFCAVLPVSCRHITRVSIADVSRIQSLLFPR